MKKLLILFVVLLATTVTFAQDSWKSVKAEYSLALIIEDGVKGDWVEVPTTFTFTKRKVEVKIGNTVFNFTQASEIMKGQTSGGYKFDYVSLINDEDGTEVILQVFNDEYFGVRLVQDRDNSIQFSN